MKEVKGALVQKDIEAQKDKEELIKEVGVFLGKRDKEDNTAQLSKDIEGEMTVKELLYKESLKEVPLPENFEPMFNSLLVTAKRNKIVNELGLFLPSATLGDDFDIDFSDIQKVMAAGPQCQQVKVGMEIKINMDNFKRRLDSTVAQKLDKEYAYDVPIEVIDDVAYLVISERDVKYITNNNK